MVQVTINVNFENLWVFLNAILKFFLWSSNYQGNFETFNCFYGAVTIRVFSKFLEYLRVCLNFFCPVSLRYYLDFRQFKYISETKYKVVSIFINLSLN